MKKGGGIAIILFRTPPPHSSILNTLSTAADIEYFYFQSGSSLLQHCLLQAVQIRGRNHQCLKSPIDGAKDKLD